MSDRDRDPALEPTTPADPEGRPAPADPTAAFGRSLVVGVGLVALAIAAAAVLFRPAPTPPPADLAGDPMLAQGHGLFQQRCVSCHGASGRGDGPISASVKPPPGDLTDGVWKHGAAPEQVLKVIDDGVPGTQMAGWATTFKPAERKALAAYCYHLARQPVPAALRAAWTPPEPDPESENEGEGNAG